MILTPEQSIERRELRQDLWHKANRRCTYCGRNTRMVTDDGANDLATNDHRTPRCRGGTDEPRNLASCCLRCNLAKGVLNEHEFRTLSMIEAIIFNDQVAKASTWAQSIERIWPPRLAPDHHEKEMAA